ncbi:MAG: PQQ-binding-like beta-propeller repeat protein [Mariniblastus sp.]
MIRSIVYLTLLVYGSLTLQLVNSQETTNYWSQFRGIDGTGIAKSNARPPIEFEASSQAVWETVIPGTGWSSPVYTGNKVWLTTSITSAASPDEIAAKLKGDRLAQIKTVASSVELHAICVDINNGNIIHDVILHEIKSPEPINPMNSYASPTPAIKDGKVIFHFGNYGTWCVDESTGEVIWNRQFVVKHSVGPGSSPIIFNDKVIIVCDGTDLQYIVAVELNTGKDVWKTDRPPIRASDGEYRKAYCTPIIIDVDGIKQAVIPGAQWVAGYNPDTGQELWRADHGAGFSITPMPAYQSGLVVFSTGYMKSSLVAVDPTGRGDITETGIIWRSQPKKAPNMPSLIGRNGKIYAISDRGILRVLEAATGKMLNEKRINGNFSSSPLLAGDNLYLSSREGLMTVVTCSTDLSKIATNKFESSLMASPIVVGDDLLVRTEKKLMRISDEKK